MWFNSVIYYQSYTYCTPTLILCYFTRNCNIVNIMFNDHRGPYLSLTHPIPTLSLTSTSTLVERTDSNHRDSCSAEQSQFFDGSRIRRQCHGSRFRYNVSSIWAHPSYKRLSYKSLSYIISSQNGHSR